MSAIISVGALSPAPLAPANSTVPHFCSYGSAFENLSSDYVCGIDISTSSNISTTAQTGYSPTDLLHDLSPLRTCCGASPVITIPHSTDASCITHYCEVPTHNTPRVFEPDPSVKSCISRLVKTLSDAAQKSDIPEHPSWFCSAVSSGGDPMAPGADVDGVITSSFGPQERYTSWVRSHLASITTQVQESDLSVPCSVEIGWTSYGYPPATCTLDETSAGATGAGVGATQTQAQAQATGNAGDSVTTAGAARSSSGCRDRLARLVLLWILWEIVHLVACIIGS